MTSIHGVDPIIVNNIKVQTQKSVVIETQKSKVSDDHKKDKQEQGKEQRHPQPNLKDLMATVEKLNRLLEQNKIRLRFQIISDRDVFRVQLIEIESGNIVSEIQPAKAFELLSKFNTTGFTINELI